jgi:hypothetical protein
MNSPKLIDDFYIDGDSKYFYLKMKVINDIMGDEVIARFPRHGAYSKHTPESLLRHIRSNSKKLLETKTTEIYEHQPNDSLSN